MSRTRDIIQEIAEVRARRQFGSAMAELPFRLFALEQAFKARDLRDTEVIRYFPVALIACVEGYFRMAMKDLVDAGEPYLTNAEKTASSIRLDFSVIRAIHGKKITVGELVVHSGPVSRIEHIEGALSGLLGRSFLTELRSTANRWAHEVQGDPVSPILAKPDSVFADVARTFELRHVICHELASGYEIEAEEIERCFESCVSFLRAADECVSELISPGAPLTQTDMNIAAGETLRETRGRLEAIITALTEKFGPNWRAKFNGVQEKWQAYCDGWVGFRVGGRNAGGSMWPMLAAGAETTETEKWVSQLSEYGSRDEGEI